MHLIRTIVARGSGGGCLGAGGRHAQVGLSEPALVLSHQRLQVGLHLRQLRDERSAVRRRHAARAAGAAVTAHSGGQLQLVLDKLLATRQLRQDSEEKKVSGCRLKQTVRGNEERTWAMGCLADSFSTTASYRV